MTPLWKFLVPAGIAYGLIAYTDYMQNKALELLLASDSCQEAQITVMYRLVNALATDQIPEEMPDLEAACAELYRIVKESQPDEESSQVSE